MNPSPSLFSCVACIDHPKNLDELQPTLEEILTTFPSRVWILCTDRNPEVPAITTSSYTLDNGYTATLVTLRKNALDHANSLLLPLLPKDSPIITILTSSALPSVPLFHTLLPFSTRTLLAPQPEADFSEILHIYQHSAPSYCDLTFAKIRGWQSILSQIFSTPETFQTLASELKTIHIRAQPRNQCIPLTAYYLQALVTTTVQNRVKTHFELSQTPPFDHHTIDSLTLELANNTTYHMQRKQNAIIVHESNSQICHLPKSYLFVDPEKGHQAIDYLLFHPTSPHYPQIYQTLQTSLTSLATSNPL